VYFITNTTGTYAADGRIGVNPFATNRVAYNTNQITAGLSALNGDWQSSGTWSLLVADAQIGNRAQFVSWTLRVIGTAATNGTVSPGNGGTISVVGTNSETLGATVDSTGTGANAVNLSPGAGAQLTLSAGLSGSGDFRQQTDGTVKVEGESTGFTGKFTLDAGELQVASSGALGTTNRIEIAGANTLVRLATPVISNTIVTTGGAPARIDGEGQIAGAISGGGGLIKQGANTIILSGTSDFSGGVRLLGGTLAVGADANLGTGTNTVVFSNSTAAMSFLESFTSTRNFTVATGTTGTLLAGSGITTTLDGTLSKDGSVLVLGGGGNFTINGVISGASANSDLVVSNSTVTLNTTNTYSGPTYVFSGGILNLGTNNAMPTNTALLLGSGSTAGTVNLTGNDQTVASLATQGTAGTNNSVNLGAGNLTIDGASSTVYAGNISGTGSLTKSGGGTFTLSGSSSHSGATTVSGGTLELANTVGEALGSTATITVTNTGTTLLISQNNQVNGSAAITLSGGTITRGSGVSEVFGALTLNDDSFLDFGTGTAGTLSFGTYTPSALLTINNFGLGNTLTFASNLSGSINNGALFSFDNGFNWDWDETTPNTFTITAIPEPSTYLAAAGLLSLMLWPSRKRLLKDAKKILGLSAPMRDRLAAKRI
ncbi:MAG: beta strand repeat-containing protein, partial [Sphaerospermopsis kisseleviana]